MNVYAPTSSSIILFAGNSNEKRSLRKILKQSHLVVSQRVLFEFSSN